MLLRPMLKINAEQTTIEQRSNKYYISNVIIFFLDLTMDATYTNSIDKRRKTLPIMKVISPRR